MSTVILIRGEPATEQQALDALIVYARGNPTDEALVAGCPHGAPYTLGDLSHLLGFGLGLEGYPVDPGLAALMERAGVTLRTVPQYVVKADAETGVWQGNPEPVGRVEMWRWLLRRDTPASAYANALIDGEDAAVEVQWS